MASNLWKSIGGRNILKGVDLKLDKGDMYTLVGGNGVGKTTLVKCIVGLYKPDNGKVIINGVDVTETPPSKRGLGVVLQGTPLLPLKNVYEHISFPLVSEGNNTNHKELVVDIADKLGITNLLYKKITELSGGERQKVAIATALVRRPKILVLDEPFSNLDIEYRMMLYQLLLDLRSEGITIILVSHIIDDIIYISDKIGIMYDGKIIESGPPEELLKGASNYYTQLILREPFTSIIYIRNGYSPFFIDDGKLTNGHKYVAIINYKDIYVYRDAAGEGEIIDIISRDGDEIAIVRLRNGDIIYASVNRSVSKGDKVSIKKVSEFSLRRVD
jgi:multiple sugar transport system ATP-binding protein